MLSFVRVINKQFHISKNLTCSVPTIQKSRKYIKGIKGTQLCAAMSTLWVFAKSQQTKSVWASEMKTKIIFKVEISLSNSIKTNKLEDFICQEESRGIGPIELNELETGLIKVIKAPQSEDQASHSPSGDGLTGK